MKTLLRVLLWTVGVVVLLGIALALWVRTLAHDDGGAVRGQGLGVESDVVRRVIFELAGDAF